MKDTIRDLRNQLVRMVNSAASLTSNTLPPPVDSAAGCSYTFLNDEIKRAAKLYTDTAQAEEILSGMVPVPPMLAESILKRLKDYKHMLQECDGDLTLVSGDIVKLRHSIDLANGKNDQPAPNSPPAD